MATTIIICFKILYPNAQISRFRSANLRPHIPPHRLFLATYIHVSSHCFLHAAHIPASAPVSIASPSRPLCPAYLRLRAHILSRPTRTLSNRPTRPAAYRSHVCAILSNRRYPRRMQNLNALPLAPGISRHAPNLARHAAPPQNTRISAPILTL